MIINNIEYPNEIIEAIQNDSLVVFAGAGVSMGSPTNLPNFLDLAKMIAEGTGKEIGEDHCDVFLGNLKAENIDVNKRAAEILSGNCEKHNGMHEAIVDLFKEPEKCRIVTTNYDRMLEQVFEERSVDVSVYNAPALPLGNDFKGIVHVHGNISDPQYMVVTDSDFGKAYLTEGYAVQFLKKLFQTYTVLFVGYSYNDTIIRYLTRAMVRNTGQSKFVLTDDKEMNWRSYGIVPVLFPKKKFDEEEKSIKLLGERCRRGLLEWKSVFESIPERPPVDLSLDTEVDFCLEDPIKTQLLADCVRGKEWCKYLDNKGSFKTLFSSEGKLSKSDKIWKDWLVDNIIGVDDDTFKELLFRNKMIIHPELAKTIIYKLESADNKTLNDCVCEYLSFLDLSILSEWDICLLIEMLSKRGLFSDCRKLFERFFSISFKLEKSFLPQDAHYNWRHKFLGSESTISHSWKLCHGAFLSESPSQWMYLAKNTICKLHESYQALEHKNDHVEPGCMYMLVIEDQNDPDKKRFVEKNQLFSLCQIFCQSCRAVERSDPEFVINFLEMCFHEPSALLKKVCLKALRELERPDSNEKFDIFIRNSLFEFWEGKEQVFLLVKSIYNDLSDNRRNALIDKIEAINVSSEERYNEYEKYRWCIWIKEFCPNDQRINKIEEDILSKYNFTSIDHPEMDFYISQVTKKEDESPIQREEMRELSWDRLKYYLLEYNEDPFEGPSRDGMLNVFSQCCSDDYKWTEEIIQSMISEKIEQEDVWKAIIRSIQESQFSEAEKITLLEELANNVLIVHDVYGMSGLLLNIVKKEPIKKSFSSHEQCFIDISNILYENRGELDSENRGMDDLALNSVFGNILHIYLYILSYSSNSGIPGIYREFFEKTLNIIGSERKLAIFVLAGHFNFLLSRDRDWYMNQFGDILVGQDRECFVIAWGGVVSFSRNLNRNAADTLASLCRKAIKHIDWLDNDTRQGFVEMYSMLLINVVDNPCREYLPEFYTVASEDDCIEFVEAIGCKLRNLDNDVKCEWWNRWLQRYLMKRLQNVPKPLTDSEYSFIMDWIPRLEVVYPEIVKMVCAYGMPKSVNHMFLYQLEKNQLVKTHPHETIKLITALLESNTEFEYIGEEIKNIYDDAKGLSDHEIRAFKEACLMRHIKL